MSKRNEYDREIADRFVAALKAGTAPWQRPWKPGTPSPWGSAPFNPTTGKAYRGGNNVLLRAVQLALGSNDSRWLTYKQATALGGQVRKGEKSTLIEYWKKDAKQGKSKPDDDAGEDASDDAPTAKGKGRPSLTVFHARVFNASQIDGLPPPPPAPEIPEAFRHAAVADVMERLGVPIGHGGDRAFYSSALDHIQLPEQQQFDSESDYWSVALHEAGHATGHPSRLNRDMGGGFGSEKYAREELRAEIFSMMAGEALQLGHDPGQHHAYVASWIEVLEKDPREIYRAASDAQRMMDFLGIEPPAPLQVAEAKAEQDQQAAFVREFDLLLQRDYFMTVQDAGLETADVLRYRDAGSAADAVREYADDYDLQARGPLDPRPSPELEQELATLRAQRDQLKNALQGVLATGEPEVATQVRQAVKP